tara:strand:- start:3989 stop:5248 length:1260 start_codon:yes stop_codon:yes gene_type:complete
MEESLFIRFVSSLLSNEITRVFSLIIILYFLYAVLKINSNNPKDTSTVNSAASNLATLGILGTFLGIFIGLLDFDVRLINKSVPELLIGLKIAFGTSILGIFFSLFFKIIRPFVQKSKADEDSGAKEIIDGLEKINKSLTDDNDKSLVSQLERLRTNITDLEQTTKHGFEHQIKEFKSFSEQMSKAFSEAIIEELKSVIREFNEKISEQFGDNFKQLNLAVGKLVDWQDNYKNQMEKLKESIDNSINSIEKTQISLEKIENSSSSIPEHMNQMDKINQDLNTKILEIQSSFKTFAEMSDKAENAFPIIEKNIQDLTQNMKETVTSMKDELSQSLIENRKSNEEMIEGIQSSFNETVGNATNKLNDSISQLDEAIQSELESVLKTMAENLSGITQKFVNDYNPLLQTMKEFTELLEKSKK